MSCNLVDTVNDLLSKGILAFDSSVGSMDKLLGGIGVEPNPFSREFPRYMAYSMAGIGKLWSGTILFSSTFNAQMPSGVSVPQHLQYSGMIPIIKIDKGMDDDPQGKIIRLLDGLADWLPELAANGARATKFRWAFGPDPHPELIEVNVKYMVRGAAMCIENGLVPIIEPELDRKAAGGTHDIQASEQALRSVLGALYRQLEADDVALDQTIVKTSMVEPGAQCAQQVEVDVVGEKTAAVIRQSLPEIAGVVFLSGGMTPEMAILRLNAIAQAAGDWKERIAASFSRAALGPMLKTWAGDFTKIAKAHSVLQLTGQAILDARNGVLDVEKLKGIPFVDQA